MMIICQAQIDPSVKAAVLVMVYRCYQDLIAIQKKTDDLRSRINWDSWKFVNIYYIYYIIYSLIYNLI